MNTNNNSPTNLENPFQSAIETKISRRSFLKRTAATILVTVLAVDSFADEVISGRISGSDSGAEFDTKWIMLLKKWAPTLKELSEIVTPAVIVNNVVLSPEEYTKRLEPEIQGGAYKEEIVDPSGSLTYGTPITDMYDFNSIADLPSRVGGYTEGPLLPPATGAINNNLFDWTSYSYYVTNSYAQVRPPFSGPRDYYAISFAFNFVISGIFAGSVPFSAQVDGGVAIDPDTGARSYTHGTEPSELSSGYIDLGTITYTPVALIGAPPPPVVVNFVLPYSVFLWPTYDGFKMQIRVFRPKKGLLPIAGTPLDPDDKVEGTLWESEVRPFEIHDIDYKVPKEK